MLKNFEWTAKSSEVTQIENYFEGTAKTNTDEDYALFSDIDNHDASLKPHPLSPLKRRIRAVTSRIRHDDAYVRSYSFDSALF